MARLKDEGMEYDDRIAMLDEVEWPKPGSDFIYQTYNSFKLTHPYLGSENVKPKTIAREMIENYQSFEDYIKTYKLERAEAVLLRHLSEVYKVLAQTVPDTAKTEHLHEAESFLELIVRHTDSSLLASWLRLLNLIIIPLYNFIGHLVMQHICPFIYDAFDYKWT